MVRKCCYCKSPTSKNITLHRFPSVDKTKQAWIDAIPIKLRVYNATVLCSRHFCNSDFQLRKGRSCLSSTAVPSVFDLSDLPNQNSDTDTVSAESSDDSSDESSDDSFDESVVAETIVKTEPTVTATTETFESITESATTMFPEHPASLATWLQFTCGTGKPNAIPILPKVETSQPNHKVVLNTSPIVPVMQPNTLGAPSTILLVPIVRTFATPNSEPKPAAPFQEIPEETDPLSIDPEPPKNPKLVDKLRRSLALNKERKQDLISLKKRYFRQQKQLANMKAYITELKKINYIQEEALLRLGGTQEICLGQYRKIIKKMVPLSRSISGDKP